MLCKISDLYTVPTETREVLYQNAIHPISFNIIQKLLNGGAFKISAGIAVVNIFDNFNIIAESFRIFTEQKPL